MVNMNNRSIVFSECDIRKIAGKNVIIDFTHERYYVINETFENMWFIYRHKDSKAVAMWLVKQGISQKEATYMTGIFIKGLMDKELIQ